MMPTDKGIEYWDLRIIVSVRMIENNIESRITTTFR